MLQLLHTDNSAFACRVRTVLQLTLLGNVKQLTFSSTTACDYSRSVGEMQ